VSHWWGQRLSAVALAFLGLWFVLQVTGLNAYDYDSVRAWIGSGVTPVLLVQLIAALAWHSALGVQVVLEDYVHAKAIKLAALVASIFFHVFVAVAGSYAVLRIAFTTT
jgi:succinate dehydrogenase / fumarate reductase membrane anchor subunit